MLGGIRTPQDVLGNKYGPSSKPPFFTRFSAEFRMKIQVVNINSTFWCL
jgi:hypothetical protein